MNNSQPSKQTRRQGCSPVGASKNTEIGYAVRRAVAKVLGFADADGVTEHHRLKQDFGEVSSLDFLELALELETVFGGRFDDAAIADDVETVGDLIAMVEAAHG
ncbi:MAG: acyl carrier protein [Rhodospirillaceae bacterium]